MALEVFLLFMAVALPSAALLLSVWASEQRRIVRVRRSKAASPTNSRWVGVDPDRRLPTGFHQDPKEWSLS